MKLTKSKHQNNPDSPSVGNADRSPFAQDPHWFTFISCTCHASFELSTLRQELQIFLTFEQELSAAVVPEEIMPLQLNVLLFLNR